MAKGGLFIVSGPSGVGKGTVLSRIFSKDEKVKLSVSATTRLPREGEENGREYFFISKTDFENKISEGKLLEYAEYVGNYYGTLKETVQTMREKGIDVILEIEVKGALQVMSKVPDAVSIFILPPSMEELEKRLTGRGTEDSEKVKKRLAKAIEEISFKDKYQYNIVNDTPENAAAAIYGIILKTRS